MPRMSTNRYIKIHKALRKVWLEDNRLFSYVPAKAQWELHLFFAPTQDLRDRDLRDYRKQITERFPALPHQAGKAFHELALVLRGERPSNAVSRTTSSKGKTITVQSTVKPEIDVELIARALIRVAKEHPEGFMGGDIDLS